MKTINGDWYIIKPCPFCGGKAKVFYQNRTNGFYVQCNNGKCVVAPKTASYKVNSFAVSAWNMREES
jgi:hypothetical protein